MIVRSSESNVQRVGTDVALKRAASLGRRSGGRQITFPHERRWHAPLRLAMYLVPHRSFPNDVLVGLTMAPCDTAFGILLSGVSSEGGEPEKGRWKDFAVTGDCQSKGMCCSKKRRLYQAR
jgi:hypothetical protein